MNEAFKASDLIKIDDLRSKLRRKHYKIEYEKCLSVIKTANEQCQTKFTIYTIPHMIPNDMNYEFDECTLYVKNELIKAEFYVRTMKPGNVLFISWDPEKTKTMANKRNRIVLEEKEERKRKREAQERQRRRENKNMTSTRKRETKQIEFVPSSALSTMHLKTSLMADNPDFAHLNTIKKYQESNNNNFTIQL